MKILITGGAGFIGSHLTDQLLARGEEVLVIDNYETGRPDNLVAHEKLKVIEGSITDVDLVESLFNDFKPDLVVHAAASYKDPNNWTGDELTNAIGTSIVVRAAQNVGCERLIYFQTAMCYGLKPLEQPITLQHPLLSGGSSYAISKTAGEHYIQMSGIDFVSFRLANAYGPRNMTGPLPTFYQRLADNKACFVMDTRRDFIYIDDMINCVMLAVDGNGHGAYHISSGKDFSIKELFDEVVKALDIILEEEVEVRERNPDDAFTILLDPSETISQLGWKVAMPLASGVKSTIEWYKEHGIEQTFTHLTPPKESTT